MAKTNDEDRDCSEAAMQITKLNQGLPIFMRNTYKENATLSNMAFHAEQRIYHVKLSEVNEVLNQTPGDVQLRISSTTLVVNDDSSMIRPFKLTNTTVPIYLATALPRKISLIDIKIMFLTLDYPKEFRAIFGAGEHALLEDFTQMH